MWGITQKCGDKKAKEQKKGKENIGKNKMEGEFTNKLEQLLAKLHTGQSVKYLQRWCSVSR